MMKKYKKMLLALGILLTGALTVGVISSSATKTEDKVLVQVGSDEITNVELLTFKKMNSFSSTDLSDSEIVEYMVKEKLVLQLAKQVGVSATLEEGKMEAQKHREILDQQPKEVQDTHKKIVKAMGITEEEYWEDYTPSQYQDLLSMQNLFDKMQTDKDLAQKYAIDAIPSANQVLEQLYKMSLSNGTVKVKDDAIRLD
ncbi:hypothetical protein [Paenibacillus faecalis]|uniref:hypothetical protein n=1 Tax=Paenibacillus faecalis TaxID=2079532 RepID=UPI000D0EC8DD|nr:hypothetical protein [Paenibacillus faecalis]